LKQSNTKKATIAAAPDAQYVEGKDKLTESSSEPLFADNVEQVTTTEPEPEDEDLPADADDYNYDKILGSFSDGSEENVDLFESANDDDLFDLNNEDGFFGPPSDSSDNNRAKRGFSNDDSKYFQSANKDDLLDGEFSGSDDKRRVKRQAEDLNETEHNSTAVADGIKGIEDNENVGLLSYIKSRIDTMELTVGKYFWYTMFFQTGAISFLFLLALCCQRIWTTRRSEREGTTGSNNTSSSHRRRDAETETIRQFTENRQRYVTAHHDTASSETDPLMNSFKADSNSLMSHSVSNYKATANQDIKDEFEKEDTISQQLQ